MKIHFDNANVEIAFADDFEKEWASKNPEIFGKTISDIKEMHVSNNALAATKSNNEKEIRISDSNNIAGTINNCVSALNNYFTNVNFDEVPNIPVN